MPISGPGTILANILGTLLNMVFALRFRSETPYTLFFQMLGTDFAVISLVDRAFQVRRLLSRSRARLPSLSLAPGQG